MAVAVTMSAARTFLGVERPFTTKGISHDAKDRAGFRPALQRQKPR